jgi:hypothetical protein
MTKGTTHEAILILLFILLLVEGSILCWLVVILVLPAFALAMLLRVVHHVGTGLTLNSFRLFIRELILHEANDSAYSIHPGSTKMYHDLKSKYWWYGMKRVVAEYIALCDNC